MRSVLLAFLLLVGTKTTAAAARRSSGLRDSVVTTDEEKFWNRFLQSNSEQSIVTDSPVAKPIASPTSSPTSLPISAPISSPSQAPITAEPPTPVIECGLDVTLSCTISGGANDGKDCDTPGLGANPCLERPVEATMKYNGGSCEQSSNLQALKFSCDDFNGGPLTTGDTYIIVSDIEGKDIIYFEGTVSVGDTYQLTSNGERFVSDMFIFTYSSNDTKDENLLQRVQFETSCASPLSLQDRFGASQLVQFTNELQGNVTGIEQVLIDFAVQVPFKLDGDSATMETLTSDTNFAGNVDLTDQIKGEVVKPGGTSTATLETPLDLSTRKTFTALTTVTATIDPSNELCGASIFSSFDAGNPVTPSVPTAFPTAAPITSLSPTTDLSTAACEIVAEIYCDVLRDNRTIGTCENAIVDPATVNCNGGNVPTSLTFIYRGIKVPQAFVSVSDGKTASTFIVSTNEIFTAVGLFEKSATIVVSTVVDNDAGETIEETTIDTSCEDPTQLILGQRYGLLQLAGFTNLGGIYTSAYPLRVSYVVKNGPIASQLESAYINSAFRLDGPFDAIAVPLTAQRGETVIIYREQVIIDAYDKFRNGITFNFGMNATGVAPVSGKPCSSQDYLAV